MAGSTLTRSFDTIMTSIQAIELPPLPSLTESDLRRRAEAIDRMLINREKMKPLGMSAADLLQQVRADDEGSDE